MKYTFLVLCSALAFVGCDQYKGGADKDKGQTSGADSSRSPTYPSGSMSRDTNTSVGTPGGGSSAITNAPSSQVSPGAGTSSDSPGTQSGTKPGAGGTGPSQ
jgi:hypothetical protein